VTLTSEPIAEHVVQLRISDPGALDRRDAKAGQEFRDALMRAADDNDIKVIVVTGLVGGTGEVLPPDQAKPAARQLYTGARGIHQVITYGKKIVIAEVDGACGPTGSALCLAADFVIATTRSTFASPFDVAEASYPLAVLTMRANRAKAWMLRGGIIDAAAAYDADFVNQVVDPAALRSVVTDLGRQVALMPLDGMTISKMNVGATFDVVGVGREFDAVEASVASGSASW
jgi:2-(1,2-epoxy-1,2-dihydrophenyl)acetyl-CoA isomerase